MPRFKLVHVEEAIKLSGWVLLPTNWEDKIREEELGSEFLRVESDFDESESEVWDEVVIEMTEEEMQQKGVSLYDVTDYDWLSDYIVEDEDE